ncbi:MAG TPA: RluA family pseudouridine synthase [Bacillus bacterium]|uniref:RNA pseudouridylate synthase n=1 Tax=Siminovitchia fordii TaxID=254759 RepID=A0ABQ4K5D5_9BACI|nr:RluA family pseudouridine synthase [Siminovitchia fordii]GIN20151.1 RNA pseudouridine synthase [Siminovitchia fordii]HBZ09227.1 RluA family pseudouridine synthase [Bacillus sp. (in: firmicutes)]
MNIPILFEDNHLLVVEKPVNVPVQEDNSGDRDLLTALKEDIKFRYQKPGNVYLGLVHRLDRPVGGVMVFAKTSKAASRLSDAIRRKKFERTYLAVVRGIPQEEARLEHFLYKDQRKNIVRTVPSNHKHGKKSILEYKVISKAENLSLLTVRLLTGRSHQIRVQLSSESHPLYGDQKYGKNVNRPGQQIALWANTLEFEHPTKKETVRFESRPPKEYPWTLWQ